MYKVFHPQNPLLKKHISSYSVLDKDSMPDNFSYYAFPQFGITIGFWKDIEAEISSHSLKISPHQKGEMSILLGKYLEPLEIHYTAYVDELAINFTTCGVNYFFKNYFKNYAPQYIQEINKSNLFQLKEKINQDNISRIIQLLEKWLLGRYCDPGIKEIEKAVDLIRSNPSISNRMILQQVFLSEKSLSRRFKKFVGCTPSEFKKICKFRKSINDYFVSGSSKNLTQIGIDNNYYDSPHFYREIKKLASFSPKEFFSNVSAVGTDSFPYIFKK